MPLPLQTDFTGPNITEAQFKTAMTDLRGFLSDLLGTAGTQAAAQVALKTLLGAGVTAKTGAYTIATADRGQLFDCTGTWTLTLPAAATAGAGFAFAVRNSGGGIITIDPDASEQIDGAMTITVAAGASCLVVCTGTAWLTVGLSVPVAYPLSVANGGTGATSAAGARYNLEAVGTDTTAEGVGAFALVMGNRGLALGVNGVYAASQLRRVGFFLYQVNHNDPSYTENKMEWHDGGNIGQGTWRFLGPSMNFGSQRWAAGIAQRIY